MKIDPFLREAAHKRGFLQYNRANSAVKGTRSIAMRGWNLLAAAILHSRMRDSPSRRFDTPPPS